MSSRMIFWDVLWDDILQYFVMKIKETNFLLIQNSFFSQRKLVIFHPKIMSQVIVPDDMKKFELSFFKFSNFSPKTTTDP